MRFGALQLLKYGHFDACTLAFPPALSDLHLIIGPNEAGKSTALAAVGDLLFDFPHVTPYDFRFPSALLRVGAVIEDGATTFEVRRRKGRRDTLLGPDEDPIAEGPLLAVLAGQTRESFERMFGLDHARLRLGGQAILAAQDDVGQAIFAAGAGLVSVTAVSQALEEEAKAIWASRGPGANRPYNAAATAFQQARGHLRDVEVRAPRWAQARRKLDDARAALAQLRAARDQLEARRRTVERRRRVLATAARRALTLERLADLGETPEPPADAESRLESGLRERDLAEAQIRQLRESVAGLEAELKDAQPRAEALALVQEVERLTSLSEKAAGARMATPGLEAQAAADRVRIKSQAQVIGWAAADPAAVKALLPARPAIAELRQLIGRRDLIDRQLETAHQALTEARAASARARQDLESTPEPPEVKPLQTLARDLRERAVGEACDRAAGNLAELEQVLAGHLKALRPWTGDAAALDALALPADEDVDAALAEIEDARAELRAAQTDAQREDQRLSQLQLERRQETLAHPAPSLADLEAARRDRDAAWSGLKAQLAQGVPPSSVGAPDTFEDKVRDADRIADERFAGAEHAGRLVALDRDLERVALQRDQAVERRTATETRLTAATAAFDRLIAAIGTRFSPEAYPAWREAAALAADTAAACAQARRDLEAANASQAEAKAALATALGRPADSAATLRDLLDAADRAVEAAGDARASRAALQAQVGAARDSEAKADIQVKASDAAMTAWTVAWAPALRQAGLDETLSSVGVEARLELIDALRGDVDGALETQRRLDEARATVSGFEARLAEVATALGPAPDKADLLAFVQSEVGQAQRRAAKVEDLEGRKAKALEDLAAAQGRFDKAQAEIQPLQDLGPGLEPDALRALLRRAVEAQGLHTELRTIDAEIVGHGDGRALDALVEEVKDADPDTLAAEAQTLEDEAGDLNSRIETQIAEQGDAEREFAAFGDSPDATIAAFAIAEARAEMAEQAELYIRKRAQLVLLRAAIDRYRREKQAPLLARASTLFSTLTLGGFSRLLVDYDGDTPRLAGERAGGAEVTPVGGMSEGTVDQLYLALRVAAVEDAVDQGIVLPFLADDLFVNFDDDRAAAGFRVLAELAQKTQVLFFTHHSHLATVAANALGGTSVSTCQLEREDREV